MTDSYGLQALPEDIPPPVDDVACDRLPGMTVLYCYPRPARPDEDLPRGWDEIPGARGCTPQSRASRDRHAELRALGARVFGLSTQDTGYQREAVERLSLPFELLSDEGLAFAKALTLPTLEVEGMPLVKRLTLVIRDGRIERVLCSVVPPGENASEVVEWLSGTTV